MCIPLRKSMAYSDSGREDPSHADVRNDTLGRMVNTHPAWLMTERRWRLQTVLPSAIVAEGARLVTGRPQAYLRWTPPMQNRAALPLPSAVMAFGDVS